MSPASRPKHVWQFQSRLRKSAFGWRGSHIAIERLHEAVSEIKVAARVDPMLAAEGAVLFFRRISPALEAVDSSSGALGAAVNNAIAELVPIIASAPAGDPVRTKWLETLWQALNDDQMPYIERLGDRWGELCASPALASQWADLLLSELRASLRLRAGYFSGTMVCFSSLLAAEHFGDILETIEHAPHLWWEYRKWGFRALVAQGKRAEALRYAEASRDATKNDDLPISMACERLLLDSGLAEEAYRRYALAAVAYESTYLSRYRTLAKKYPEKLPSELLADLVTTTPGEEGKWFAAAKSAGLFDEALSLVRERPCDPKTLMRAARDFAAKRPEFSMECALAGLRWAGQGYGYELMDLDVMNLYRHGAAAAERLGASDAYADRAKRIAEGADKFVKGGIETAMRSAGADTVLARVTDRRGG